MKSRIPTFLLLINTREELHIYLNLAAFMQTLIRSNPSGFIGAMNVQQLGLFLLRLVYLNTIQCISIFFRSNQFSSFIFVVVDFFLGRLERFVAVPTNETNQIFRQIH